MPRVARFVRAHTFSVVVGLVLLVGAGAYAYRQVKPLVAPPYTDVAYVVPQAPQLHPLQGETVYRIDPQLSSVGYEVQERFAGQGVKTAKGVTNGVAGDLALNRSDPAASRVGKIVIDVEQFHSDNNLRDARIRHDYLESHAYPLATFTTTALEGLPDSIDEGAPAEFTMKGDLTVKKTTRPVSWKVRAQVVRGELSATATTTLKMSDFGVGPISVVGLLKTDDEVDLTFDLVAADPGTRDIPTTIDPPKETEAAGGGPSFSKEIQPILEANCASCHNKDQIGWADWNLATARDASRTADGIALVTRTRYMPPWPPSKAGIPLMHPRDLSQADIDKIKAWADAGGSLDVDPDTPVEPRKADGDVPMPRRDRDLTWDQPYTGSLDNKNDYRCFLVDPHFTEPTYITGYSFVPGDRRVVHHTIVYHVSPSARSEAEQLDGSDGKPGWPCYVGTGLTRDSAIGGSGGGLNSMVAGWVPGQRPLDFGDGAGFLFEKGDLLVVQMHYHYDDNVWPDRSHLYVETAPGSDHLKALQVNNPIAPVEVPCPTGMEGPLCDRSAALQRIGEIYGPIARGIPGFALSNCGRKVEDFAAMTDGIGTSSCDVKVRTDGRIVDVLGHMHTLGKSFRMTLNPGTPDQKVLLDIPTWNFDWQLNYQPVDPPAVKKGDTIRISCTWDRSIRRESEAKYLLFAEGTEDEMCFSTYTVLPDDDQ